MICTNIRNVRYLQSYLVGIELLKNLSNFVSDDIKLKLIAPYLCCSLYEKVLQELCEP